MTDSSNWGDMIYFVKDVISAIYSEETNQTRVGALTFSDTSQTEFYLDAYNNLMDLTEAFDAIQWTSGETNIYSAIHRLRSDLLQREHGDRENVTNIAIVLTDGQANVDDDKTAAEAEAARNEGVEFIAVGITRRVDLEELELITGDKELVLNVLDFRELMSVVEEVAKRACHLDSIDPISPDLPDSPAGTL